MLRRLSEVNHVTMELTPDLQEKKIFLIEGLKKTYKDQYDAIQPLPYVKDRLYCVDNVFVEGGVEVCLAPELTRGTGGAWERLESYKSIYTDFRLKSKRRIIQGEPGYGKSTLTLQLAYDWCNDVSDSPINNVEILILLRLRQLGSVKSIFRAIKSFLLSNERRVSKHDVEKILGSCSSVHIILDGYDEYPGRDSNDNDDVHRIIKMELFANFDVSLTTRYLPEILRKETKRATLTGFDDKARDEYIRKAVVGNNDEAVEKIIQRLYENSILADLCQVPLIFVMFAHMAHDERAIMKFKSVTQFFKHMIRCFYDHLKQKFKVNRSKEFYLHEMEHHELDKIAFEGLNKRNQQLSWIKTEFRQRVGPESYDQYILIGILVEEVVVSDASTGDDVLFTTMVRFYHKLFCEWYAAQHLVTVVKNAYHIGDTLRVLDPVDLQYLFRFACGLDPDAGKELINHLKRLPGGDSFAILCILEQTGDVNEIMDSVKDLCSRDVKIKRGDSALLQRSTTQLLAIASNNDIRISCLHLDYSSIKFEGDTIILHIGISLPLLPTVEKLHIAGSNAQNDNSETSSGTSFGNQLGRHLDAHGTDQETLTEKDTLNLFRYGTKCRRIKELMFDQLQLPISISPEAITNIMKTRNIRVRWRPFDINFHLDLQSGQWEVDDTQVLENIRSSTVSIDGSVLQQRSNVQLLHVAHRHNIPICSLLFNKTFGTADNGTIILNTGIQLTNLPPLQKMHVVDEDEFFTSKITEQDIVNILLFAMKDQRFNVICFEGCLLPVSFSSLSFTNTMISRAINVSWCPFDSLFHLDLQTGLWGVDNTQVLENIRSSTVSIDDSVLQQRSNVQLLHVAHRHNIPISCLHLEYSSIKIAGDNILLHSGISLPTYPTVERIHITGSNELSFEQFQMSCSHSSIKLDSDTLKMLDSMDQFELLPDGDEHGDAQSAFQEILTEKDILNLFRYGIKCRRMKEMVFCQLQLPTSISPEAFTNIMKTGNIKVCWSPFDIEFHLDLQNGHWEVDNTDTLRQLCSDTIHICDNDDKFKQKYNIMLINIASSHEIPISCLHLDYSSIKFEGDTMILHSGIPLPKLPTVKKIHIAGSNQETLTEKDILNWFRYVMKCRHVKELMFCYLQLPTSVSPEAFTNIMKTRNIRVRWRPFDIDFHLDLQNGHWEVNDIKVIINDNPGTVFFSEKNSILQDTSTLQLLEIARNDDIPISILHLEYSSIKFEGDTIILHRGISLPILPTVENIHISSSYKEHDDCKAMLHYRKLILKEKDILNWFQYGMKCGSVKELMFDQFWLPTLFSSEAFTDIMKAQKIQVRWRPFDIHFHLDLETGRWEVDNIDTLRQLCSDTLHIYKSNDTFKQKYTIMCINIASRHEIPISCLHLYQSLRKIDAGDVILHSGLHLSCPVSVKKVVLEAWHGKMTETEVVDILKFVQQSHMLEELAFEDWLLPLTFSSGSIPAKIQCRDIKVFWNNYGYSLNLQSGVWEVDDVDTVKRLCTENVNIYCYDSELLQRCTIKLLENASDLDIHISCLYLGESFCKIDAGNIILHSKLCLSCPVSVKKVVIDTGREKEMTETEVVDILMFVQQSHLLEELEFECCMLPSISSSEAILAEFQTRGIKVLWASCGYSLNLQSSAWEVDVDAVKRICKYFVSISSNDSKSKQRCTRQLLENASDHDIPIYSLYLKQSLSKIDAGDVILYSGLRLSCPVSVKKVEIDAEEGRVMTETEVVDILMFVQQSHMLEVMNFKYCLLPQSIPAESIPSILKSRNVKVSWWTVRYKCLNLNLKCGRWMIFHDGTSQEITDTEYNGEVDWFRDRYRYTTWQKARISSESKSESERESESDNKYNK